MSDPTLEPAGLHPARTRLIGWKEIAAYLGRGVRTAQRWEREFGLPVRRMGPDRGESVFAFADEVDAWLASAGAANARGTDSAAVGDTDETGDAPDASDVTAGVSTAPLPGRRRWLFAGLAVSFVIVSLASVGLWRSGLKRQPSPPEPTPALVMVQGDGFQVEDADGRTLWSHRFGFPLEAEEYEPGELRPPSWGILDVDGDGLLEVWFISRPLSSFEEDDKLWLFGPDGTLRWNYQHTGEVRFGSTDYRGPWSLRHLKVTPSPDDTRRLALWAISTDRVEYPCLLQRLDPDTGRPLTTYWSAGFIESVGLATLDGRTVLLVGGASNDQRAPSLAVLDAAAPNGSSPAVNAKYRCGGCPPGQPLDQLILPLPRRLAATGNTGAVMRIEDSADGLVLLVLHASAGPTLQAYATYRLDTKLRPVAVDTGNLYDAACASLARQGSIPASTPVVVDPRREFLPILKWHQGGYVPVDAP